MDNIKEKEIEESVKYYYWEKDFNCAETTLLTLSKALNIELMEETIFSATALPGAAKNGAQCGIVSGVIMLIGIMGNKQGIERNKIQEKCHVFVQKYEEKFGSLLCRELRPQGFNKNNPPHLCLGLTIDSIKVAYEYINTACRVLGTI